MAYYFGDALKEIEKIKGTADGHLDMNTLPNFARRTRKKDINKSIKKNDRNGKESVEIIKIGEEEVQERDLGAMISMLTVGVQQLNERLISLEKKGKN